MKKSSGRSSLSQGVLSVTSKDAGKNLSLLGNSGVSLEVPLNVTPRVVTPTKSLSVELPQGLSELSLSDIEIVDKENEPRKHTPQKIRHTGAEVLVTEINDKNILNSHGEVDTISFKTKSPAKVICHSPTHSFEGTVPEALVDTAGKPTEASLDGIKEESIDGDSVKKKKKGTAKKKKYLPVQSKYRQTTSIKDNTLEVSCIPPRTNAKPPRTIQKGNRRTQSTPYLTNSIYENPGGATVDGSILDTTAFQMRAAAEVKTLKTEVKTTAVEKNEKKVSKIKKSALSGGTKASSSSDLGKQKSNDAVPLSQLSLDLHYARNLQMTYSLMKAKQVFEKEEEKATSDLYGLWAANCKLEKDIKTLEQTVEMKQLEISVDQLLGAQVEGLTPIEEKFSQVIVSTSKLSDALTNTAHYLPVKNVIINENKVLSSLEDSKRLLAELTTSTRANQPEIKDLAKTTEALKKTLSTELSEQKMCGELLASCNSLVNHERSLQVQLIQENE